MKNKLLALVLVLVLFAALAVPAFADGDFTTSEYPRCLDTSDLLSENEFYALLGKLNEISNRQQFDVVVCTVEAFDGENIEQYTEELYDFCGFGFGEKNDGVMLLLSMAERDWAITSTGFGMTALNPDAREAIFNEMKNDLANDNYAAAFNTFADLCDKYVTAAKNGEVYKAPFDWSKNVGIAFGISLIIGLICVSVMKGQLKSVRKQKSAANYVKEGSLHVTVARENFLYRTVSRTAKQKSSSGSSGSNHSSSSGKF